MTNTIVRTQLTTEYRELLRERISEHVHATVPQPADRRRGMETHEDFVREVEAAMAAYDEVRTGGIRTQRSFLRATA